MKMQPLISVITVVYNGEKHIESSIESVLAQTYGRVEYIIIDGGSSDGTVDIIKKYEDQIDYWVSESDEGLYQAMNKGIKVATGEWIHLLNSDDYYVSKNVLEKAIPCLNHDRINYFDIIQEHKDGKRVNYSFNYIRWALFYSAYLPHPGLIVSNRQYQEIGLYSEKYKIAADHDFILRLTKKYTGNLIGFPLTVMRLGGLSSQNEEYTFYEFMNVTIANGLASFVAKSFYFFKVLRLRLRNAIKNKN